jgi:tetratricopeptide (TPR) repeat protein
LWPLLGLVLAVPSTPAAVVHAQDWGLTRERDSGRDRDRSQRSRGGQRSRRSSRGESPDGKQRTEQLIARYKRVLERDPGRTFAFNRLLELYRKRDGNIDELRGELEERVQNEPESYAPRMLLGHIYRTQGKTSKAREAYDKATELAPRKAAPREAMARIDREAGRLEQARTLFEQTLERTRGGTDRRKLLRALGRIALEQQDYEAARGYYDRISRGAQGSIYLKTEYARALSKRDEHERAVQEYRRVLRQLRGDKRVLAPVLRDMGRAQLEAGHTEKAIETLDRALRLSRGRSGVRQEVYDIMVEAYRRADRLDELLNKLKRRAGRSFEALQLRGRIHDELGHEDKALQAYRRALKIKPRDIDTRLRVVQLLSRSGRIDKVIEEYRRLIDLVPKEPRFVVELAQLLMQVGRREEALRLAERTGRRYPNDASLHRALAELYTRWGEEERATEQVRRLVKIQPKDPSHLISLGTQQLAEGRREQALETWRRILKVDPNKARAYATLGGVYADHDMLDKAEEAYREATKRKPEKLKYVRGLANVLERPREHEPSSKRRERDREAVRWWRKVLELAGDDRAARREARQRIVGIWARRRELRRHMAEWRREFLGDPPDVEAGRFLAQALLHQRPRKLDRAEEVLQRVIELEPGDVGSLLALERVRTSQGDLAGSIDVLKKLVEADPKKATTYLQRMAEHALALYRDEEAVEYAERAVQRSPKDAQAHRRLGDLYRARQDMDQAVGSYRRAIELNDRLFSTYFDLAELHMARGELEEADRLFRRVMRASPDDDLVARATRASIQIHLGEGTLRELEQDLLPLALGHPQRPIYRKLLVELYDALTRPLIEDVRRGGPPAEQARNELRELGSRAIKPLLEALSDEDPSQQRVAVDVLGYLGNENAAGPLLAAAEGSAAAELRARALAAAGAVAPADLTPRFVELARGTERRLRGMAAWSLARMGGRRAVEAMRELAQEDDPTVRAFAALGLGRAGDRESASKLEKLLREDRNVQVQACAAWALGRLGDRNHVPALVAALRGRGGLVSRAAAAALGRIGDVRAQDALAHALFDLDAEQRRAAAVALRRLARSSAKRPQDRTRFPMPRRNVGAGGYLDGILSERATEGPDHVGLAPLRDALAQAARDALDGPVERVRTALDVLGGREDGVALGQLTRGLHEWPDTARGRAEQQLEALARELLPALVQTSRHPDGSVRERALRLIAHVQAPEAAEAMVRALDDEQSSVQRAALVALRGVQPEVPASAVKRVAEIARDHPDWSTRLRAAETLGQLGGKGAEQTLVEVLQGDSYAFVRSAAARALGRVGGEQARRALRRARDEDAERKVRDAAAEALEQ